MNRRTFLAALAGAAVAACGGGRASSRPSPGAIAAVTPADMLALLYWDAGATWATDPSESQMATVAAAVASRDERLLPYLLDLSGVPSPYAEQVNAGLREWLGDFGPTSRRWVEQLGTQTVADDTPEYLRFKQALFRTVQEGFGGFLDPTLPRRISAQEVRWGGVGVDGIPPLESPRFVSVREALGWAFDDDQVIGVEIDGDARCYPRRIIDWHEMVNDTVGGVPVSLAYCTLCNSAILYDGRVNGEVLRFGTSGLLYRSNKLMYDRTTMTLWGQYTGQPAWGALAERDLRLTYLATVHTTFAEWVKLHPDTLVLDIDTGFSRDYGPGVAYADYWASPNPRFPVPIQDSTIDPKAPVFTVRLGGATVAYPISLLAQRGFLHDTVDGTAIVVLRTADGSGGRAYAVGSLRVTKWDAAAGQATTVDGRSWTLTEEALLSGAERLERVAGHNSFWFAITNHEEGGRLYQG